MSQLPHPWQLNHFIFFSAHFLSVNVFQGEGVLLMNCFYFYFVHSICFILYIAGMGVNPGEQTVYHMCKTWLQKVHSGWDMGGL